jgi:hypothetical protein
VQAKNILYINLILILCLKCVVEVLAYGASARLIIISVNINNYDQSIYVVMICIQNVYPFPVAMYIYE